MLAIVIPMATDPVGAAALAVAIASALGTVGSFVMSKRALDWTKRRDTESVTPNVRVELEHSLKARSPGPVHSLHDRRPWPMGYCLTITVTNDGETTEYLRRLSVRRIDAHERSVAREPGEIITWTAPPDRELAPHNSIIEDFEDADALRDWGAFVAVAQLASGKTFASGTSQPDQDLIAAALGHNKGAQP